MRKELWFLAVILAYAGLGWWIGSLQMTSPTLTVGSDAITLVQSGPVATYNLVGASTLGTFTVSLASPSTAGTALILFVGAGLGVNPVVALGDPWTQLAVQRVSTQLTFEAWAFLNNPGGIQTISGTFTGSSGALYSAQVSEWSNVTRVLPVVDTSGTASATSGTTLPLATAASLGQSGDAVIAGWYQQRTGVAGAVVFTTPAGFTRLADDSTIADLAHMDLEYQLYPSIGQPPLNVTLTSDTTTNRAAGILLALTQAPAPLDESSFITHGSIHAKLNTLDLGLMLGGRHLLESSGPGDNSGHLLEDGSGVRLLDTYLPQLGDPVTMTNPSWSGRVTSVNSEDVFQDGKRTNYNRAAIEATNSTVAPGGTAPGDFADTAVGGHHLLEDGTGARLLEDGTYYHLLEGTAFVYRNLSVRKSQNQDGTTTTYGYLETFETGYAAGQTFTLTSVNLGIAAVSYTITNVTTSFIGAGTSLTPVYGIEFGDAYQTLQTAAGGALTRTGSQATQQLGVAMPAGTLGYAPITANQTGITTQVDVTGLSVTITVVSGRRVRLSAEALVASSTATDTVRLLLMEGATQLMYSEVRLSDTASTPDLKPTVILQPSAGVHTYKVQAVRSIGAGNMTVFGGVGLSAFILAEDIGT